MVKPADEPRAGCCCRASPTLCPATEGSVEGLHQASQELAHFPDPYQQGGEVQQGQGDQLGPVVAPNLHIQADKDGDGRTHQRGPLLPSHCFTS